MISPFWPAREGVRGEEDAAPAYQDAQASAIHIILLEPSHEVSLAAREAGNCSLCAGGHLPRYSLFPWKMGKVDTGDPMFLPSL